MALTKLGKGAVAGLGVIVVGAFAAVQIQNTQEIAKVKEQIAKPLPTPIVKVVTPTEVPTATPSAGIKTRISSPAAVTKGVK